MEFIILLLWYLCEIYNALSSFDELVVELF